MRPGHEIPAYDTEGGLKKSKPSRMVPDGKAFRFHFVLSANIKQIYAIFSFKVEQMQIFCTYNQLCLLPCTNRPF